MLRYAILDADCPPGHAARLADAGVDYLQLRAKSLPIGQLATLARRLLAETAHTPTRLLLNARADVALATQAHGVHLTSHPNELTPAQIRQLFHQKQTHAPQGSCHLDRSQTASPFGAAEGPPHFARTGNISARTPAPSPCSTSLSCHTLADIDRAHALAPDLILFGPIFEKRVPATPQQAEFVQPGIGLAALEAAVRAARGIPVLALGGITDRNTHACLEAGAAGIAAIRLFA